MKRIIRDVRPTALRHLLERPPHAYLAFIEGSSVDAAPVAFRYRDGRYYVGIAPELVRRGVSMGAPVTLLLDDGWYWYELQSIRLRGTIGSAELIPPAPASALTWFEVLPRKLVAWDYGALREGESDGSD